MNFIEFESAAFTVVLFVGMILIVGLGRRVGARERAGIMAGGAAGVGAVEAAIFALLGLLIAFTFQGAATRFDARRSLIVQEANTIGTAWLRIDLLPADAQPDMRDLFRQYLDSRLETYRRVPDMAGVRAELVHTAQLQNRIWKAAIASHNAGVPGIAVGLLPALNQMFDITTTRTMATENHPPLAIFLLLGMLCLIGALLVGYGTSPNERRGWLHTVIFSLILSMTIYVIVDVEFPRLGIIRVDSADHVLLELREAMP